MNSCPWPPTTGQIFTSTDTLGTKVSQALKANCGKAGHHGEAETGTVVTTVPMATHVGFNLAPQADTCEMSWPEFRGLGQKDLSKQQIPGGRRLLDRGVGVAVRRWCLCAVLCVSRHQGRAPGRGIWSGCWQVDVPQMSPLRGWHLWLAQHPSSQGSIQVGTQSPPQKAGSRLCSLDVQCVEWGKSPQLSPVHLRPAFSVPS